VLHSCIHDTADSIVDRASEPLNDRGCWLLLLAHPGHELRAYHLIERVKPLVAVITDGSGATGVSRLDQAQGVLLAAGARLAPIFGALTDRDAYAACMASDATPFLAALDVLVDVIVSQGVSVVAIDAAEGYNPIHDVCHWLGRAAAARARHLGAPIELFEIDLVSHPDGEGGGVRLALDAEAFERKLCAITRCPALKAEADAAFAHYGQEAFRVEFLRRISDAGLPPASWVPYYEQVGEERVKAGRYSSVLRYGSHVRPVLERLLARVSPPSHATAFSSLHQ
jgi:hypothetical protein